MHSGRNLLEALLTSQESTAIPTGHDVLEFASKPQEELRPIDRMPMYFGRDGRPLFGWLHQPARAPTAGMGLVICNPFGNEAISCYRSLRHLADAAARQGIATLRFDYDGAGNSAGHDMDPDRVAAWLASVGHACDKLREGTGLDRLCLVGIRLGAMLAALEAARRPDVAGLIAIAPVVSGRAYVRELRLMRRAIDAKRNITRSSREDAVLETAGFLLSAQTRQSLGEIDLNRMETAPANRVLILDRAEMPSAESWGQRLDSLGAQCERINMSGYAQMMLDAHESIPPVEMIAATVKWVRDLAKGGSKGQNLASRGAASQRRAHLPHTDCQDPIGITAPAGAVEETAVLFGETPSLFGIVSVAATPPHAAHGSGKALILLNAGAVHHIGPNRLHVTLARNLARSGHVVLRLDLASIGDSDPRGADAENTVYSQRALSAIEEAIQYLRQSWNAREVLAAGVCSGAYHAFKAAVKRLPLECVIVINPLTFFWKEGMSLKYPEHRIAADMARYRISTLRLSSWIKLLSGGVNLVELTHVLARRADAMVRKPVRSLARLLRMPLRDDLATELSRAVQAGTYLQFVFATNDPGLELLREQGGATLDRLHARGKLGIEVVEGGDHTFTDLAARARLAALIAERLNRDGM